MNGEENESRISWISKIVDYKTSCGGKRNEEK